MSNSLWELITIFQILFCTKMLGPWLPDDGCAKVLCRSEDWCVNDTCQMGAWHVCHMIATCWTPECHVMATWACLITAKCPSQYHNHLLTGVMVGNKAVTILFAVTSWTIRQIPEGGWVSSEGELTRSTSVPMLKYELKEGSQHPRYE